MENVCQSSSSQKLGNNEQKNQVDCIKSSSYNKMEIASSSNSASDKSSQPRNSKLAGKEKNVKSSKISSALDTYCESNLLNESADFIENELQVKFKSASQKKEVFLCEICKEDIIKLDVHSRSVHVNNCIDKQLSSGSEVQNASSQIENVTSQTETVLILECPLCFKHFSSIEQRSNHIKKCGKSKGLSLQSIIKALELQERHVLERISLGLPAKQTKPVKPPKNPAIKKAVVQPKSKAESDIQLAKALSLSLTNSSQRVDNSSEIPSSLILKPPAAHQRPGKKAKNVTCTPVLVLRSEEDRKSMLLEKVASIVALVNNFEQDSLVSQEEVSTKKLENDVLAVPGALWYLSSKASEKQDYYIEELCNWIYPSDVEVGAKICHLSQIPGHEIVTQLPCNYTFSTSQENDGTGALPVADSHSSPVIASLCSLVASSWMSDVDIHTSCGTVIPAHRLLLAIRCPTLKQDNNFCTSTGRVALKWETVSFNAALQFLNFVYTGNIDIEEDILLDLIDLAKKYDMFDLQDLLNKANDKKSEKEWKKETVLNISEPLQSPGSFFQPTVETEGTIHGCESQEDVNMDLEIVCNCISSSLMPSQLFNSQSENKMPSQCLKCSQMPETRKDFDVTHPDTSKMCLEDSDSSDMEKDPPCSVPSPRVNSSSSPIIFDASDSENSIIGLSDNETSELPVSCSQKPASVQVGDSKSPSPESNDSKDSVQFLEYRCSPFKKTCDTVTMQNGDAPLSPKFSMAAGFFPAGNNLSQDSQVSDYKTDSLLTGPGQSVLAVFNEIESPVSPHLKDTLVSFHSKYEEESRTAGSIEAKDISYANLSINNNILGDESVFDKTTHYVSPVKRESGQESNRTSGEFGDEVEVKMSSEISLDENCASPNFELNDCAVDVSSGRISTSSVELVCDMDTDSKPRERILCETPPLLKCNVDSTSAEIESEIPLKNSPRSSTSFCLNTSLSPFYRMCDPVCDENFFDDSHGTSGLEGHLQSSKKSESTKENPSTETDICVFKSNMEFSKSAHTHQNKKSALEKVKKKLISENLNSGAATPCNSGVSCPQFRISDSPVTPLPDFKSMMTPEIKEALSKIGVKPLPRRKAVAILSHVYSETHPTVDGENNAVLVSEATKQKSPKVNKSKKRKPLNENLEKPAKKQHKQNPVPREASSGSPDSDDSYSENPEWSGCVPEMTFTQSNENSPTKPNKDDIESIKLYIQSNEVLYSNVLTYTPLNLVEFHQELKDNDIKISIQKLMDFLDEQCITFTCPRKEEYRKKQNARTQRFRKNMIAKMSQQAR